MTKRTIRLKEMQPLQDVEYVPSPEYRYNCDDSLGFGPFRARVDENGFIRTGNAYSTKFERVLFFGGSFVESLYVPEDKRFISISERTLNSRGNDLQLLNGGYSGTSTLHMVHSLLAKAFPLIGPGGKVMVFIGQTDTAALLMPGNYWDAHARMTTLQPGSKPTVELPSGAGAITTVLNVLLDSAAALGLDIALGISAFRSSSFSNDMVLRNSYRRNREKYERARDMRQTVITTTRKVCEERGISVFDGQQALNGDPKYFYDELHLNTLGQETFERFLSPWLQRRWGLG